MSNPVRELVKKLVESGDNLKLKSWGEAIQKHDPQNAVLVKMLKEREKTQK